jgi:putative ABC transport system ATP-binding protein
MEQDIFEPIIKVDSVTKTFGQGDAVVNAIRGITLDIFRGEFVIIFGPSGSGKSTLLNLLSGLDSVTTGTVEIDKVDISTLSMDEKAVFHREKVGIVFQAYNLIPTLTIRQNIALPLVFSGVSHDERSARAEQLLEEFKLPKIGIRLPAEVSGGQQQRVGIMRALVNKPPILIADEPTGNLDSVTSRDVMQLFRNLNQNLGVTVVVVTHDPTQFPWADRVVHVLDGQIIKQTIYHQRNFYANIEQFLEQRLDEGVHDEMNMASAPPEELDMGGAQELEEAVPDEALVTGVPEGAPEEHIGEEEAQITPEEETVPHPFTILSGFERLWAKRSRLDVEYEHILNMLRFTVDNNKLKNYSEEELLDMLQIIRRRIHNEISTDELVSYLDTPAEKGGAGMHSASAHKLAEVIEGMLRLFGFHPTHPDTQDIDHTKIPANAFDHLWYVRYHFDKESEIIISLLRDWLSDYQLQHLEEKQLLLLVQTIRERIAGVVQSDEIYNILDKSVSTGGVGLYNKTAGRLAQDVNSLVELFELLRERKIGIPKPVPQVHQRSGFEEVWMNRSRLDPKNERILMILGYLLDRSQKTHLSAEQILSIIQLVRYRIEGIITPDEFEIHLDAPEKSGGAGLYKQVAHKLGREIERIMELFTR